MARSSEFQTLNLAGALAGAMSPLPTPLVVASQPAVSFNFRAFYRAPGKLGVISGIMSEVGARRRLPPRRRAFLISCMALGSQAFVPSIRIQQADGSVLVRPGVPVVMAETVSTREAAKLLGLSIRTVSYQCEIGLFQTAHKPGGTPRSPWRIAASEVQARKTLEF